MKFLHLTLFFLLFSTTGVFAKKVKPQLTTLQTNESGKFVYEKVIDVPGTSKQELYNKMKAWVLANIKTVDNNIVFDDNNFGSIVTTPTLGLKNVNGVYALRDQLLNFKLIISFKENKFRIEATSFHYKGYVTSDFHNESLDDLEIPKMFERKVTLSIDGGISEFMNELESVSKKKDKDW